MKGEQMEEEFSGHVYLNNSYSSQQIDAMQAADGNTIIIDDLVSQDQLAQLQQWIKTIIWPEHGKTSKYAGAGYDDPPYGPQLKEMLNSKLQEIIGPHVLDFYAWQEAILPWKIHADLRWYADKIPYKVILIPIDVIGNDESSWQDTYSLTFKQRDYLRNNPDTNTGSKGNTDQAAWDRSIDQPNVEGCIDGYAISPEIHQEYLSHVPYEYLEGLEIDKIFQWKPGSAVIWDQDQLHCADNFLARNIKTKLSIILFTNQI